MQEFQRNALAPNGIREVVCYAHHIANWEYEADVAKRYVGGEVRSHAQVRVYLTGRHGFVYAHSNFVVSGQDYPTKLCTNSRHDLLTIVRNLVCAQEEFGVYGAFSDFERAYFRDFSFFVDEKLLAAPFDHLDFDGLQNCKVLVQGFSEPVPLRAYLANRNARKERPMVNNVTLNFGPGARFTGPLNVGENIRVSYENASNTDEQQLRTELERLVVLVSELAQAVGSHDQKNDIASQLRVFVEESKKKTPSKRMLEVTGAGLAEAAKTVAALAVPVAQSVKAVLDIVLL